jgi:hypothetical protein
MEAATEFAMPQTGDNKVDPLVELAEVVLEQLKDGTMMARTLGLDPAVLKKHRDEGLEARRQAYAVIGQQAPPYSFS